MPHAYVIAGSNGAGKTTFVRQFLPRYASCREFLNADLMAAGISPFDPDAAAMAAARILFARMKELIRQGKDFGFETTSCRQDIPCRFFRDMRERGYRTHLFYLWLPDVDMAIARVAERVEAGRPQRARSSDSATIRRWSPESANALSAAVRHDGCYSTVPCCTRAEWPGTTAKRFESLNTRIVHSVFSARRRRTVTMTEEELLFQHADKAMQEAADRVSRGSPATIHGSVVGLGKRWPFVASRPINCRRRANTSTIGACQPQRHCISRYLSRTGEGTGE